MTSYKSKVKAVYPKAFCANQYGGLWYVVQEPTTPAPRGYITHIPVIGSGKTAFLAWVDAWRNIEPKKVAPDEK